MLDSARESPSRLQTQIRPHGLVPAIRFRCRGIVRRVYADSAYRGEVFGSLWWRAVAQGRTDERLGSPGRRHAAAAGGMELEPRSMPDRKDLRDLEMEQRPSAHGMARDSKRELSK